MSAVLLLSLLSPAFGVDPPAIAWVKGYNFFGSESHPHAGVETADGGFIAVGDGLDYGANASKAIKREIFVLKTDALGSVVWQQRIGDCGYNYGKFAIEAVDGSVIVAAAITECVGLLSRKLQRSIVRLDGATGAVLQTLSVPNDAHASDLTRDGFMCVTIGADDRTLIATGFVRGESATGGPGYPDEPMFLIEGGSVVVAELTLDLNATGDARSSAISLNWELVVDDSKLQYRTYQGMRVLHDATRGRYVVSHTTSFDDGGTIEMGLLVIDAASKAISWMQAYPAANAGGGHASHPYALAQSDHSGAYAIGGLAVRNQPGTSPAIERCEGRLITIAPLDGKLAWDSRWHTTDDDPDANIECYGLQSTGSDGGWITTCGWGVEPELHPKDSDVAKTWRVLVERTDSSGAQVWQTNYTDNSQKMNNAGEYIIAMRDGRYAVYVDSQSWGPDFTGGNFAIMVLNKEGETSMKLGGGSRSGVVPSPTDNIAQRAGAAVPSWASRRRGGVQQKTRAKRGGGLQQI